MNKDDLQRVRDWANDKIAKGADPPWAWYRYMQLREAIDALISGMDATVAVAIPADSPQEDSRRGSGHLRLVDSSQPSSAPPDQDAVEVPLPM